MIEVKPYNRRGARQQKLNDVGGDVVTFAPNNHNGSSFVELGRHLKFSY